MTPEERTPTAAHAVSGADAADPPRARWPRRLALLALVVLIGILAAFGTRFGTDPTVVDSPLIGRPAPEVVRPYLERPGTFELDAHRGEVVVVNFWASWCVPCREEHADLLAAAERYRDRGVTFVGVVYQDREESAVRFLDELGRGYDHVVDPRSEAAIDFGVFGVPETFFVGPNGTVEAKVVGKSDLAVLSRTIESILAGDRPASVARTGEGYDTGR